MKNTVLFFIFLFIISCLGQVASDIYLPALPAIRNALGTTTHLVQFSIAVFMFGFAVSHLVYGPISDSVGRKKPLIIGILICIIGTFLCQYATSIHPFLLGRLLQGAGAGAGAALFRSILRDVYSGDHLAKVSSIFAVSRVFLLASSPLIGGYLLHFFGWRSCFLFLNIYAGISLIGSILVMKETNKYMHLHSSQISYIAKNAWTLISSPIFMGYSFCILLAFGGILAWITTLPIILQEVVGLTPVEFGWVSAIAGLFFIVGGFANAMLVTRFGLDKMLKVGLAIMLLAGLIMLVFGLFGDINTFVIMFPVVIYILGTSMIFSNAYAGAFHPFPKIAGTAGAIFGFLQIIGGAISSMIMSFVHAYNQIPLSLALIASSVLAFIVVVFATRGYVPDPSLGDSSSPI